MAKQPSIKTLAGEFKNLVDLQHYCNHQYETIVTLKEENEKLRTKLNDLENIVTATTPLIIPSDKKVDFLVSSERAIIDAQIRLIKEKGMDRELSLEETKRLDILIKNKKVLQEIDKEDTFDGKSEKRLDSIEEAQLIKLVQLTKKEPTND